MLIQIYLGGIVAEASYKSFDGTQLNENQLIDNCNRDLPKAPQTLIDSWEYVDPSDEGLMKCLLVEQGPFVIYLNVTPIASYSSGIYLNTDNNCESDNHAIVVVGYGTDMVNGALMDYWSV